jgi:hypothetical protein
MHRAHGALRLRRRGPADQDGGRKDERRQADSAICASGREYHRPSGLIERPLACNDGVLKAVGLRGLSFKSFCSRLFAFLLKSDRTLGRAFFGKPLVESRGESAFCGTAGPCLHPRKRLSSRAGPPKRRIWPISRENVIMMRHARTTAAAPYYCIARPQELWFERLDFGILAIRPGYPLQD